MKVKNTLKFIFFSIVAFLMIGLLIIIGFNEEEFVSSPKSNSDYKILYKYDVCAEALELLYEGEDKVYFLPCISSHAIYLEWDDGTTRLMIDELNDGRVSIDSLVNHGLNVHIEDRYEQN